jgi:hypothetical protein
LIKHFELLAGVITIKEKGGTQRKSEVISAQIKRRWPEKRIQEDPAVKVSGWLIYSHAQPTIRTEGQHFQNRELRGLTHHFRKTPGRTRVEDSRARGTYSHSGLRFLYFTWLKSHELQGEGKQN